MSQAASSTTLALAFASKAVPDPVTLPPKAAVNLLMDWLEESTGRSALGAASRGTSNGTTHLFNLKW